MAALAALDAPPLAGGAGRAHIGVVDDFKAPRAAEPRLYHVARDRIAPRFGTPPALLLQDGCQRFLELPQCLTLGGSVRDGLINGFEYIQAHRLGDRKMQVVFLLPDIAIIKGGLQLIGVIGPKDPRTITITVSGPWNSLEGDEWADDSDGALNFGVFPEEYKLEIDNKEVVYYDVEANEVRLDGKSITKDLNKRLKRSKGLVSS